MKNTLARFGAVVLAVAAAAGCAQTSTSAGTAALSNPVADNTPEPTIVLVPVQVTDPALQSGCWAQFYTERNFMGDVLTMVGPSVVASMDNGTARALKRELDSVVVGPKATLQVFEHARFRDKTVDFAPNTREGVLRTRLGFGGRIEALKLICS